MARPQKYNIQLTDKELARLRSVIRKKDTSRTIRSRCQIISDLDEAHGKVLTHEQSAKSNGVCMATVTNTVAKYINGGIDAVTELKRNINSDNARRKIDGRAEAQLIELACGPVPEGHSRWTIRLLEKESKVILETPVGREAIRNALKKQTSTSQKRLLVHPLKRRVGIHSSFAFVEPLGGVHHVSVREHRTAVDWAEEIKYLVDVMYPDAKKIILVMDNLNTHKPSFLYKRYSPEEARRITKKLEIHYTPKHGSCLDVTEIELNVMTRQCLGRRISDIEELRCELSAWEIERNILAAKVNWHFRTNDARIKLSSLYPAYTTAS